MTSAAWVELKSVEYDKIWSLVYDRLEFRPSMDEQNFPGFREPSPSITYSISGIWGDDFAELSSDMHLNAGRMFRQVVAGGDFLYALDWQHPCYRVYPDHMETLDENDWKVPVLPNGDYYIFLEPTLKFGWLGHPWEQTVCIFGSPLLDQLKRYRPNAFRDPIRRQDPV